MEKPQLSVASNWQRPFFTIWVGQAISLIGSSLVQFALIWWLTEKTHSATVLATASLMTFLPNAFLAPFAGVVVDRYSRRFLMIVSDALVALATLGLAVLLFLGHSEIQYVYLVLFLRAAGGTFQFPAMRASTSLMVPESDLSKIAGYNQILNSILRIGTPPLGALLIGRLPLQNILMIDVITALLGITPLFFIAIPQPKQTILNKTGSSFWSDLKSGMRYITSMPGFLYLILMMSVINFLLDPAFSLMPILVQKHFQGDALQFAWVRSAQSIGGLVSGFIFSVWLVQRKVLTSMLGIAGVGIGCLVLGLAPSSLFWLAILGAFLISLMMGISDAPIGALFQARIVPEMQGRVFTVMASLMTLLSPLGLLIAGPVADHAGVQVWFIVGGAMCLLMGLTATRVFPIMQLEEPNASIQQPTYPSPGPE